MLICFVYNHAWFTVSYHLTGTTTILAFDRATNTVFVENGTSWIVSREEGVRWRRRPDLLRVGHGLCCCFQRPVLQDDAIGDFPSMSNLVIEACMTRPCVWLS